MLFACKQPVGDLSSNCTQVRADCGVIYVEKMFLDLMVQYHPHRPPDYQN